MNLPRVLFLVEGYTDIRFITALAQVCRLTLLVPQQPYFESGLNERVAAMGTRIDVKEIRGGRITFQLNSFRYLQRCITHFDVVLCQEVLRGSFNGTIMGALRGVPTIMYMCIAPVEYFRCRYERHQCTWLTWMAGQALIRLLMTVNGKLATRCVALGPYLCQIAERYSSRTVGGFYYGVDTSYYHPVEENEKRQLRQRLGLPQEKFLVLMSSRISHEKDPETVLKATATARSRGLDAAVINLGGGYQKFLELARQVVGGDAESWAIARPAAHPMTELAPYYQASDCLAQASLAEGLGLAPLEALACGIPVICTAVGGLLANLQDHARLTPVRDHLAMAKELLWVAAHPHEARMEALEGRSFVIREWSRDKAIRELANIINSVRPKTA